MQETSFTVGMASLEDLHIAISGDSALSLFDLPNEVHTRQVY